jgi:tRNA (cmo5U34)-methyltransferase
MHGALHHLRDLYYKKMSDPSNPFSSAEAVARYAENPPRVVPGFADLQRMAALLLAERASEDANILVLGAGGGLELKVFAQTQPKWQFEGVDPSAEMLTLAEQTLGPLFNRVQLRQGYIDAASEGPFDGAACLLTLHFIAAEERHRTITEVHRRLKPGAPFVVAHLSFPQAEGERALWLSRYAAFAASSGIAPEKAQSASDAVDRHLHILTPEQDEGLLHNAGFSRISQFYAGFAFRGWVAYA